MKNISLNELIKRFMNKEMLQAPSVKEHAQTALIGALIIFVGMFFSTGSLGTFQKTEATVSRIDYVAEDNTETSNMRVYVSYTVDGKEYKDIRCSKHDSDLRVGDTVQIEYSTEDASQIRTLSDVLLPYAIFGGGGIVFIFGLLMTAQNLSALDGDEFKH